MKGTKTPHWHQCPWCGLWFFGTRTRFCCEEHYRKWHKAVERYRMQEDKVDYGLVVRNGNAGGRI